MAPYAGLFAERSFRGEGRQRGPIRRPQRTSLEARPQAEYLNNAFDYEYSSMPFEGRPHPAVLKTAVAVHGGVLPAGLAGRIIETNRGGANIWFKGRGVYRVADDLFRRG